VVIGKGPYRDGRIQPEPHGFDLRVKRIQVEVDDDTAIHGGGVRGRGAHGSPLLFSLGKRLACSYLPSGSVFVSLGHFVRNRIILRTD
jgi:hypothetical protein